VDWVRAFFTFPSVLKQGQKKRPDQNGLEAGKENQEKEAVLRGPLRDNNPKW